MLRGKPRQILVIPRHDPAFSGYLEVHSFTEAARATAGRQFRVLWVLDPADTLRFEALSRLAYDRGDLVFAVDELHEYCPNSHQAIGKYFKKLCLHGRHANVEIFGISQRPANLHKDFLSQAATIHVFKLTFPGDMDALKRTVPDVDKARNFKVGEYLTFP